MIKKYRKRNIEEKRFNQTENYNSESDTDEENLEEKLQNQTLVWSMDLINYDINI
jgi:hypothetical protein